MKGLRPMGEPTNAEFAYPAGPVQPTVMCLKEDAE